MTPTVLNFKSILSKTKDKLIGSERLSEAEIHITTNDIEVLEKLHTASCTSIFFTIENQNKTYLFIPDAFSPFIINKNNFEAHFFNKSKLENDKLQANHFYGDSIIVEFEKHIELLDLNNMAQSSFNKNERIELVIDFYETKLRITY